MNCLRWLAPVQCVLPLRRRLLQSAFNWCRRQKQNNHTARLLRISVVGFFFWIYWHSSVSNKQCHNFNSNHGIPFSSVAQSCLTICDPMNHSTPGLPVHHQLSEFTQTHVHRVGEPSSHLILCRPLLLLPPIPPSIRVFSNELTLRIRWPKYWSFSFSIIPSKETPGLISFRMDWLDVLAVQGTLKSLLQHHSSKASILQRSAFFTGKHLGCSISWQL